MAVAHALPGRTRLRIDGPRLEEDEATRLAEALAALPGMAQVEMNRRTGGVLCVHAPELSANELLDRARKAIGVSEPPPSGQPEGPLDAPCEPVSEIAVEIAQVFKGLNRKLCLASDGQLDLGVLTTLTFLGVGVAQIVSSQQIPVPPWFNLAWWGFRTFMTLEGAAVGDGSTNPGIRPVKT
jgi:hypothetical protein